MKRQKFDPQIEAKYYKIPNYNNVPYFRVRTEIITALNYIKWRGVKLRWTREFFTKIEEDFTIPKMPTTITLYTYFDIPNFIYNINECLDRIYQYDEFQKNNPDNEKILEIKKEVEQDLKKHPCEMNMPEDAFKPAWQTKRDTIKNAHGFDIEQFAADLLYYKMNPDTKMNIPNAAYIMAEKAVKRYLETGTTQIKNENNDKENIGRDLGKEFDKTFLDFVISGFSIHNKKPSDDTDK